MGGGSNSHSNLIFGVLPGAGEDVDGEVDKSLPGWRYLKMGSSRGVLMW
jgi:hypothetical protein